MGDFRLRRYKLPPEAFLIHPDKEIEPTDMVDPETWGEITTLPDDVSLRTSEHHGSLLRVANKLVGHWGAMVLDIQSLLENPRDDALALVCLDAGDDFQASIYLMLTGFYRQSIATLRMALEGILTGAYFRAFPDPAKFSQWVEGYREGQVWVKEIRNRLMKKEPYRLFEKEEHKLLAKDGWINFLYSRLSAFSHGRPYYTDDEGYQIPTSNVGLWGGSNGPVYEPRAVKLWEAFFWDTALLCLSMTGLAEERLWSLTSPTGVHIEEFLKFTLHYHPSPHPVSFRIYKYIKSQ